MTRARATLDEAKPYMVRHCRYCGQSFATQRGNAAFCSQAHQMRQWVAVKMLAGTYGYVNGRFVKVA